MSTNDDATAAEEHDDGRLLRLTPAARMAASIVTAVSLYGISFGALAVAAGFTFWQTVALSVLMFTGGSQFAFIGVIAAGGSPAAAFSSATLLGVRNTLYAVQIKALLNPLGWKKLLAAQVTIDESMAAATAQPTTAEQRRGFWLTGVGIWIGWSTATAVGALLGDVIADPEAFGLDGAVVAAFLGLLWPRLKSAEPWALAVLAALVTTLTMPVVPAGLPVLIAAVVAIGWGMVSARLKPAEPPLARASLTTDDDASAGTDMTAGTGTTAEALTGQQGRSGSEDATVTDDRSRG